VRDLPIATPGPTRTHRWGFLLAKILLSVTVILWFAADVDMQRMGQVLRRVSPGWLVLAFLLKAVSLWLHEARIWMALPVPRPRLGELVRMCLGIGLLNLVLPARGGDVAIIAGLNRRWQIPVGTATAVIGVTSFLEAAAFGLILLAVLGESSGLASPTAGASDLDQIFLMVALTAAIACAAIATIMVIGRVRAGRAAPAGLLGIAHRIAVDTAALLTDPRVLATNTIAAVVQVGFMVAAFAVGLPAAGLADAAPLAAAGQILALSSLASVILPPAWGVGPAAASKLVLGASGLGTEEALLYAAVYWIIAHLPFMLMGLPSLWSLRDRPSGPQ